MNGFLAENSKTGYRIPFVCSGMFKDIFPGLV